MEYSRGSDSSSCGSESRAQRWLPLLLVAAALAAYANSLAAAFVFDDRPWILQNQEIRSLANWRQLLTSTPRPVLMLSLALNYAVNGLDPLGYHLVNLCIHVLAGLTLFGILRRTLALLHSRGRCCAPPNGLAFAVALLWLVHPLTTQAVTYVIQRGESLMSLFFLLTLYAAIRHAGSPRQTRWCLAALACSALGMATKEVMVSAPALVLLFDRSFLAGSWSELLRRRAGLHAGILAAAALVLFGWIGIASVRSFARPDLPTLSVAAYATTEPAVILHYLRLALWPHPLCFDYGWAPARAGAAILPAIAACGALLLGSAWALLRGFWPGYLGAWFFGILAPTSSVVPIQDLAVEHRMYLPLAAPIALIATAVWKLSSRLRARGVGPLLLFAAALALAGATARRNQDYRNPLALQQTIVATAPNNPRAHYNLGTLLRAEGRGEEAIAALRRALSLDPRYSAAHFNLGNALGELGQVDAAMAHYEQAIAADPRHLGARINFAGALHRRGQLEAASLHYAEAVRLHPASALAHYNFAVILGERGLDRESVLELHEALRLRPRYAAARNALGNALVAKGDLAGAMQEYQETLRHAPHYAKAHRNLGGIYAFWGRWQDAILHYQKALEIDPHYAKARSDLAAAERAAAAE